MKKSVEAELVGNLAYQLMVLDMEIERLKAENKTPKDRPQELIISAGKSEKTA